MQGLGDKASRNRGGEQPKQSPDIGSSVHVGKESDDVGAGDQGIIIGYASDEVEEGMPLTHSVTTRLGKKLTEVRKNGELFDGRRRLWHGGVSDIMPIVSVFRLVFGSSAKGYLG